MLKWLFDTSMGSPGLTGDWPTWMTVLFHLSNAVTFFAFAAVPLFIVGMWGFKRDGLKSRDLLPVLVFFPAVAMSRAVRVLELWGPPYHLTVILDFVEAVVTTYSVSHLPVILGHVMRLPSRDEIHRLNNELNAAILEKEVDRLMLIDRYAIIGRRVDHLEHLFEQGLWTEEARRSMEEIRAILNSTEEGGSEWRPKL